MTSRITLLTAATCLGLQLMAAPVMAEDAAPKAVWSGSEKTFGTWENAPLDEEDLKEEAAAAAASARAKAVEAVKPTPAPVPTPVVEKAVEPAAQEPAPVVDKTAETTPPAPIKPEPAAPVVTAPEAPPEKTEPKPVAAEAPVKKTDSRTPIEISASKSLEWNRGQKTYTAIGDAVAAQGNMKVTADRLTARYAGGKGTTDISKIEAENSVTLQSTPYIAYGDHAVYDTATGVAVMTGKNLRIETPTEKLTATEKIEFFDRDNRLTITGSPKIIRGGDTLTSNVMNAYFVTDANGKRVVDRFTADGNVTIKTPRETVTGEKGVYNITTQKATITGDIRIKQGDSVIEGTRADIDLNTGISKLFAEDNKTTGGRVKGIFYPSSKK